MARFIVEIAIGNDAMQTPTQVANVLELVAGKLRACETLEHFGVPLRDENGNRVGDAALMSSPVATRPWPRTAPQEKGTLGNIGPAQKVSIPEYLAIIAMALLCNSDEDECGGSAQLYQILVDECEHYEVPNPQTVIDTVLADGPIEFEGADELILP